MTATTASSQGSKRSARRKVAAILAGGLVLGVGIMATLASWNDSELAAAGVPASQFTLGGAVDASPAAFFAHATPPALLMV